MFLLLTYSLPAPKWCFPYFCNVIHLMLWWFGQLKCVTLAVALTAGYWASVTSDSCLLWLFGVGSASGMLSCPAQFRLHLTPPLPSRLLQWDWCCAVSSARSSFSSAWDSYLLFTTRSQSVRIFLNALSFQILIVVECSCNLFNSQ